MEKVAKNALIIKAVLVTDQLPWALQYEIMTRKIYLGSFIMRIFTSNYKNIKKTEL
jgi:hypothetical protein